METTPSRSRLSFAKLSALFSATLLIIGATACAADTPQTDTTSTFPTGESEACAELPDGFSFLTDISPETRIELRYATTNNFTGAVVSGYEHATDAVLRTEAATALAAVQSEVEEQGLGLLVYDGFRPTRAVADFVAWSKNDDDHTKAEYYPDLEKPELFELGYIAAESNHSLGGTVDLTLVSLDTGLPLDMGGEFDFFGERSHGDSAAVTPDQAANRLILQDAMLAAGFAPYAEEWWHYSYPVPAEAQREDFPLEHCANK